MSFNETLFSLITAAKNNCLESAFQLGLFYYESSLDYDFIADKAIPKAESGYDEAYRLIYQASLGGHIGAEQLLPMIAFEIAHEFRTGTNRDKDIDKAITFLKIAHEYDHTPATLALARIYASSPEPLRDVDAAIGLYSKVSQTGQREACYELAILLRDQKKMAQGNQLVVELLKKASLGGHSAANYELGYLYYYGIGLRKDAGIGLFLMEKAAARHHNPKAIKFLGDKNEEIKGLSIDLT